MYQVKVYDRLNTTLKKTISPKDILSDISFSLNTNGWLWEQTIELAYSITDTTFFYWDIVKITMFNDNNKNWVQIYMWYVTKIGRHQTTTRQTITLTCLWVASLLTEQRWSFSLHDTTSDMVKEIIDDYNTNYANVFTYNAGSIDTWGSVWWWHISGTYLEMLQSLASRDWKYLFIDWEWVVWFKDDPTTPTHYFTNRKDVEKIDIEEDLEWVINSISVTWEYTVCSWSPSICNKQYVWWSYDDTVSISLYGKRVWKTQKIYTNSSQYCDDYAENYVNKRGDPKKEAQIVINRQYNLESLKPWDTIKVRNFEYDFNNVRIEKINYTPDRATLYLDEYVSFGNLIVET